MKFPPKEIYKRLAELQYERNQMSFVRSTFRVQGDVLDIFPAHYEDRAWRISFFGDEIESICEFDSLTGKKTAELNEAVVYPANHYVRRGRLFPKRLSISAKNSPNRLKYSAKTIQLLEAQQH